VSGIESPAGIRWRVAYRTGRHATGLAGTERHRSASGMPRASVEVGGGREVGIDPFAADQ